MRKRLERRSIREIVFGALGTRPKRGWTASELNNYVGTMRDDYSYKSITAMLAIMQKEGAVRKLCKRPSEITNSTSYAYTRV